MGVWRWILACVRMPNICLGVNDFAPKDRSGCARTQHLRFPRPQSQQVPSTLQRSDQMNRNNDSIKASVVGLFLIATIVAGCDTSTGTGTGTVGGANPLNPNTAPSSTQKIHIPDD